MSVLTPDWLYKNNNFAAAEGIFQSGDCKRTLLVSSVICVDWMRRLILHIVPLSPQMTLQRSLSIIRAHQGGTLYIYFIFCY